MMVDFNELSPIVEQSEVYRKVLETARVASATPRNRITFWGTLRELLLPHPALFTQPVRVMPKRAVRLPKKSFR